MAYDIGGVSESFSSSESTLSVGEVSITGIFFLFLLCITSLKGSSSSVSLAFMIAFLCGVFAGVLFGFLFSWFVFFPYI